jgi:hypothetical protein
MGADEAWAGVRIMVEAAQALPDAEALMLLRRWWCPQSSDALAPDGAPILWPLWPHQDMPPVLESEARRVAPRPSEIGVRTLMARWRSQDPQGSRGGVGPSVDQALRPLLAGAFLAAWERRWLGAASATVLWDCTGRPSCVPGPEGLWPWTEARADASLVRHAPWRLQAAIVADLLWQEGETLQTIRAAGSARGREAAVVAVARLVWIGQQWWARMLAEHQRGMDLESESRLQVALAMGRVEHVAPDAGAAHDAAERQVSIALASAAHAVQATRWPAWPMGALSPGAVQEIALWASVMDRWVREVEYLSFVYDG